MRFRFPNPQRNSLWDFVANAHRIHFAKLLGRLICFEMRSLREFSMRIFQNCLSFVFAWNSIRVRAPNHQRYSLWEFVANTHIIHFAKLLGRLICFEMRSLREFSMWSFQNHPDTVFAVWIRCEFAFRIVNEYHFENSLRTHMEFAFQSYWVGCFALKWEVSENT